MGAYYVPGFTSSFNEFAMGHNDDCCQYAEEIALACVQHRAPSAAHMDAMRTRDIQRGWMNTPNMRGTAVWGLVNDLEQYEHITPIVANYKPGLATYSQAEVMAFLEAHKGQPVIFEINNATALYKNEHGPMTHYVCVGAFDDVKMVALIANGDQVPFNQVGTYWVTIPNLVGSAVIAMVAVPFPAAPKPAPQPAGAPPVIVLEKNASGAITGAHDDKNNLHIGAGFAYAAQQQNLLAQDITTGESYIPTRTAGNLGYCVIGGRYLGTWNPASGVHLNDWAEAANLVESLHSAANSALAAENAAKTADATALAQVKASDAAALQAETDKFNADEAKLAAQPAAQPGLSADQLTALKTAASALDTLVTALSPKS